MGRVAGESLSQEQDQKPGFLERFYHLEPHMAVTDRIERPNTGIGYIRSSYRANWKHERKL